jgi:transposase
MQKFALLFTLVPRRLLPLYCTRAPRPRHQILVFHPSLDDMIPDDHPVRVLDDILRTLDWSDWEAHYRRAFGRPPHPPQVMAAVLLYGLRRRARSSRQLEYLVGHNFDFMWLAEGRNIDHSTLSKFRTRFAHELRGLFRQVNRLALAAGLIRFVEVGFDGTRVKANNGRFQTWTAAKVEKLLDELQAQFDQQLEAARPADAAEAALRTDEPTVPTELADRQARQQQLRQALEKLRAADTARAKDGLDPKKNPAQLPSTDPDAKVLPNKEGGYAPNYTPLVAADGHKGFLVDADVIADTAEHLQTLAMVERIEEDYGQRPDVVLADGAHATGTNIAGLQEQGVELLAPVASGEPAAGHPALRPDPQQPVSEAVWPQLPLNPQTKKLDKSCFVYDAARDCHWCPQGQPLAYEQTKTEQRRGETVALRVYRASACASCPLAGRCVAGTNKSGRTVTRDTHAEQREQLAAKMATTEAKQRYRRRMAIAETPFGLLKGALGLRQFLLRGLEKVKTEWLWACTAVNTRKLVEEFRRWRGQFAALIAQTE